MGDTPLILIVDDIPSNLHVIFSTTLMDAGYEVIIAKDGERAIKQTELNLPNLILLDIIMPGIDEFEICRLCMKASSTQNIPIIFMTALSDTTDKVIGFNLGAVDYITKPFQEAELLIRVKTHLKLNHLNRSLEQRTSELTVALQKAQQLQMDLMQSMKLSSLEQLVAGIAHKINNPASFIQGNLFFLNEYSQNFIELLYLYKQHHPETIPEIQARSEEMGIELLIEDMSNLIFSIKPGSECISDIVKSLRSFSCLDEAELKTVETKTRVLSQSIAS